jgi:hypothetical protein
MRKDLEMLSHEELVRQQIARGWSPGGDGKALLIEDAVGCMRLVCWRTLGFGGPHHLDVAGVEAGEGEMVRAYITLRAAGDFELLNFDWPEHNEKEVAEEVLRLQPQLQLQSHPWDFR